MKSTRLALPCLTIGLLAAGLWSAGVTEVLAQQASTEKSVAEWKQSLAQGDIEPRRKAAIATRSCERELQRELLPDFIELLRYEKDGQIRLAVLDTLTDMGPAAAEAIPALVFSMRHDFGGRGNEERHQDYRAALVLASIGRPAVEALRNLLGDEAENIRAEAAMAVGRIGPEAAPAIPDLIALFDDKSSRVRADVEQALGSIGADAVESLLAAMKSDKPQFRAAALRAIGKFGLSSLADTRGLDAVRNALADDSAEIRAAAVTALASLTLNDGRLNDDELQAIFLNRLQDVDEEVRVTVVNALASRPQMLSNVGPQLSDLLTSDDERVAWHAAFLLQLSGPSAVQPLLTALNDEHSHIEQIARSLALFGKPVVSRLEAALDDPRPRARQGAALALGQIRPLSADTVAKLAAGLNDDDREVQAAFLKSIRNLGTRARTAVPSVREMLHDESPDIRMQVIDILLEAAPRDGELIAALTAMINDRDLSVQQHAINAIRSLGPYGRTAIPAVIEKLGSSDNNVRTAAAEFISSHGRSASEAVPDLIMLLDQAEPPWLNKLIETLGGLGATAQSALPKLTELARDDSSAIRMAAVQALGSLQLSPEQIQSQLVRALHDEDAEVQSQASRIIRRFGSRGTIFVPDLIALTADEQIGGSISRMLDRFENYSPDSESITRLIGLLEDEQTQVRRMAIRFLGLAGPRAHIALDALQPLSEAEDEEIRAEAMGAMAKIREETP